MKLKTLSEINFEIFEFSEQLDELAELAIVAKGDILELYDQTEFDIIKVYFKDIRRIVK